jgi:hypothetical protein
LQRRPAPYNDVLAGGACDRSGCSAADADRLPARPPALRLALQDGATPLFAAICKGHAAVVDQLIEAKVNFNVSDKVTPLTGPPCPLPDPFRRQLATAEPRGCRPVSVAAWRRGGNVCRRKGMHWYAVLLPLAHKHAAPEFDLRIRFRLSRIEC